jgi:general secretion pathway protein D
MTLAANRASADYAAARRAEKAGDVFQAYLLAARAAARDRTNAGLGAYRDALQTRVAASEQQLAAEPPAPATSVIPATELSPGELAEAAEAAPPPHLNLPDERKSFNLRGDARAAFEQVSAAFGFQVVFESDYQSVPPFRFQMEDVTATEALRALEAMTSSFIVPVNAHLALVVRDTPQRRADTSPAMSIAIPIPERLTVQEAQELVTAVQQIVEIRRIAVDPLRRLVFLRDQVSKVRAAQALLIELSRPHTQVEVEVELLSVSKTSSLNYGLSLPTSAQLVYLGNVPQIMISLAAGFLKYATFGGGASLIGIGFGDAAILAQAAKTEAQSILTTGVTASDGQATTLHIGDRYPVIVNGYYGPASGSGQVYAPPPTVNFEDLGLVLKITPAVHDNGDITLDVDTQYSVLGPLAANNIPSISLRKYQGKVRMAKNQWGVIAGLVEVNESDQSTGWPWVDKIPWIGKFLRVNNKSSQSTQVLILLKPRLLNLPPWEQPSPAVWVGTESKPLTQF